MLTSQKEQELLQNIFSHQSIFKVGYGLASQCPTQQRALGPNQDNKAEIDGQSLRASIPKIYFIGIKGTGMCALAQLLHYLGYDVSGSDVEEYFYTDELLASSGICYNRGFAAANLPEVCDLVIYSAAYNSCNPEYAAAQYRKQTSALPMLNYPEALGYISRLYGSCIAVIGVHGKTTSTLLVSALMQSLGLAASAVAGAGAPHLGGNAYLAQGTEILAVEACEYRNHFFQFDPGIVLLTSLEWDHQDFFTSYEVMKQSFADFIAKDSIHTLIYCADDLGVRELIAELWGSMGQSLGQGSSPKCRLIPYGFSASQEADFAVSSIESTAGQTVLHLRCWPELPLLLNVPGEHLALNALGALAALYYSLRVQKSYPDFSEFLRGHYESINQGLQNFRGASRRSEFLGEIQIPCQSPCRSKQGHNSHAPGSSVIVLDDYAHHPTAISKTLSGLKKFYPGRRLVLDFMPHTYSRTISLHNEFCLCFDAADILILHNIYGSAREQSCQDYDGRVLWQSVSEVRQAQAKPYFFEQPLDALETLEQILQPGDLFVTMGAGSNRELALALLEKYRKI